MASIARRTAVLGFSRLAQRALAFLSPVFMVRLLTVEQFGEYRDFLLYSTMIVHDCRVLRQQQPRLFHTAGTVTRARVLHTGLDVRVLHERGRCRHRPRSGGPTRPVHVIREYKIALFLYTLFLCNLDAGKCIWIAKKQTINVLYYSLTRLVVRMTVVILAAYLLGPGENGNLVPGSVRGHPLGDDDDICHKEKAVYRGIQFGNAKSATCVFRADWALPIFWAQPISTWVSCTFRP